MREAQAQEHINRKLGGKWNERTVWYLKSTSGFSFSSESELHLSLRVFQVLVMERFLLNACS